MHMLYECFLDSHLDNQRLLSIKSSKYLMFPQRTVAESGFGQRLRYTSSLAKEMPRSGLAAIEESHEILVVFQTMVLVYFEHLFKVCNALHFFFSSSRRANQWALRILLTGISFQMVLFSLIHSFLPSCIVHLAVLACLSSACLGVVHSRNIRLHSALCSVRNGVGG